MMNIIYKKVSDLMPYVNNPRKNDKAVDSVAESIKSFGFKQPIVIDKNGEIIVGHTRLKAAIKLGLKEIPCLVADDLTEKQIKAYRIADNKVSELSQWDFDLLKLELNEIEDFTGFEPEILYDFKNEQEYKEVVTDEHGFSPKELQERYLNSIIRQIILTFNKVQYDKIIDIFEELKKEYGLENNTEVIIKLLEERGYECN